MELAGITCPAILGRLTGISLRGTVSRLLTRYSPRQCEHEQVDPRFYTVSALPPRYASPALVAYSSHAVNARRGASYHPALAPPLSSNLRSPARCPRHFCRQCPKVHVESSATGLVARARYASTLGGPSLSQSDPGESQAMQARTTLTSTRHCDGRSALDVQYVRYGSRG